MSGAAAWRGTIQQTTAAYANEPGGAPPWPIVESMVDIESGGDASLVDPFSGAVGLGQIVKGGYEYGEYAAANPGATIDLRDPRTNLSIMVYGLARRHQQGGFYANWYGAAGGYLGAATVSGPTGTRDAYGTGYAEYTGRIRDYLRSVFGLTEPQIEAMGAEGKIPASLPASDPGTGSGATGSGSVPALAGRAGVFVLGLLLVLGGAMWLR